ncbi:MAG: hypothetical protein ISR65_16495 [Bacteriovoracaceae bacterium]|nr:hypothetical protein [Bacteriovoracaceae bacterium]
MRKAPSRRISGPFADFDLVEIVIVIRLKLLVFLDFDSLDNEIEVSRFFNVALCCGNNAAGDQCESTAIKKVFPFN